jgi:hypothetical protein
MSLTGIAALIAAVSFAVLACAGVYLAVRFTRVLDDAATLVRETKTGQQELFSRANAAVDRANAQLDQAHVVTASMDDLGASITEPGGLGCLRCPACGRAASRHRRPRKRAGGQGRDQSGTSPGSTAPSRGDAMIRRGFWLAVGATAGIMGYRRAAALGRKRAAGRGLARGTVRLTRDIRRFNRDVREGMDQYLVRHPGQPSPTLGAGTSASTDHDERVKDDR